MEVVLGARLSHLFNRLQKGALLVVQVLLSRSLTSLRRLDSLLPPALLVLTLAPLLPLVAVEAPIRLVADRSVLASCAEMTPPIARVRTARSSKGCDVHGLTMSGALQAVRASIRFPMMQLTSVDTTRASLAHMSVMTAPDLGGC